VNSRKKLTRIVAAGAAIVIAVAIALISQLHNRPAGGRDIDPAAPPSAAARPTPGSYLGVYAPGAPGSYAGVSAFTATTGVKPGVVVYYSGWLEPFQASFAEMAARHHAAPLVQIDPTGISLTAIASGRYDTYLRSYASAVKAFGGRVIIGFGHEMNGNWYSWANQHTSPAAFVAAWRHIVTVFRADGAWNVTWLWTVNVIQPSQHIPSPAPWWPGSSYVTWVGIDGYYLDPSWTFASLFGPTIKAVRTLTLDPILISEVGAAPVAGKPAKIANLFAGVRAYGLLGFVWFDASTHRDYRITSPAAFAAFRRGAQAYQRAGS
jgi:mannan endo-1,4-beta-mannosidase